jgi:hypothetical protein
MPWKFGAAPNNLPDIGWIAIDVNNLPVSRVAPLFGNQFPNRGIYLNPGSTVLPIANRVRQTGIVAFQPSESGYR